VSTSPRWLQPEVQSLPDPASPYKQDTAAKAQVAGVGGVTDRELVERKQVVDCYSQGYSHRQSQPFLTSRAKVRSISYIGSGEGSVSCPVGSGMVTETLDRQAGLLF
jgi:hypothetical protein